MIITISSMKGGTGKSTLSFHLALDAYLKNKHIITYDCDHPQYSFSKYYQNRKNNPKFQTWDKHYKIETISQIQKIENEEITIIDTPGRYDKALIPLHKQADIIITPINDSFIDISTIMETNKEKWGALGSYYEYIYEAMNHNPNIRWILLRNKCSPITSNHSKQIQTKLTELSHRLNFELIDGTKERNIYKELFTQGATVFDFEKKLSISNLAAKFEIQKIWKHIMKK